MHRLRHRFTYANVVSTLCLCLLVGGGVAYATHENIRSSDIVDETIKRADIAPSTGKMYAGHKTLAGDGSAALQKVFDVPGIATLEMACFDTQMGSDSGDTVMLSIKNISNETLFVTQPGSNSIQQIAPNDITGGGFHPSLTNVIYQIGSGGRKAQLATFIVSAEALIGTDNCYAQAHAFAHIQ